MKTLQNRGDPYSETVTDTRMLLRAGRKMGWLTREEKAACSNLPKPTKATRFDYSSATAAEAPWVKGWHFTEKDGKSHLHPHQIIGTYAV